MAFSNVIISLERIHTHHHISLPKVCSPNSLVFTIVHLPRVTSLAARPVLTVFMVAGTDVVRTAGPPRLYTPRRCSSPRVVSYFHQPTRISRRHSGAAGRRGGGARDGRVQRISDPGRPGPGRGQEENQECVFCTDMNMNSSWL